jgi:outer membrane receptor protein involved in Fe transport
MSGTPKLKPLCALLMALLSGSFSVHAQEAMPSLGEVTVTGTREARLITETPNTVDTVSGERIRQQRPSHPSQVMNQVPGVWVSNLSGEGHSSHSAAADNGRGLSLSGGRYSDALDRLLQPQRDV